MWRLLRGEFDKCARIENEVFLSPIFEHQCFRSYFNQNADIFPLSKNKRLNFVFVQKTKNEQKQK